MKMLGVWLVGIAALPLSAGAIDASRTVTALLNPGDSLAFVIPTWNYSLHAAAYGLPMTPSGVSFTLISAASLTSPAFEADLQSADGLYSVSFGYPLSFTPGYFSGSGYSGPVSTLEGTFYLASAASQQIFGGGAGELVLRNLGPSTWLGLPPNTLQQDLLVSLFGGPIAVGALHGTVLLQESVNAVPEPSSGSLLVAVGIALCLPFRAHPQKPVLWRRPQGLPRRAKPRPRLFPGLLRKDSLVSPRPILQSFFPSSSSNLHAPPKAKPTRASAPSANEPGGR